MKVIILLFIIVVFIGPIFIENSKADQANAPIKDILTRCPRIAITSAYKEGILAHKGSFLHGSYLTRNISQIF